LFGPLKGVVAVVDVVGDLRVAVAGEVDLPVVEAGIRFGVVVAEKEVDRDRDSLLAEAPKSGLFAAVFIVLFVGFTALFKLVGLLIEVGVVALERVPLPGMALSAWLAASVVVDVLVALLLRACVCVFVNEVGVRERPRILLLSWVDLPTAVGVVGLETWAFFVSVVERRFVAKLDAELDFVKVGVLDLKFFCMIGEVTLEFVSFEGGFFTEVDLEFIPALLLETFDRFVALIRSPPAEEVLPKELTEETEVNLFTFVFPWMDLGGSILFVVVVCFIEEAGDLTLFERFISCKGETQKKVNH
jgi:hypothetical protein